MVVVLWFVVHLILVNTAVWVSVEDVCPVGKVSSRAGKDISACTNHVCSESELLAVKDEEVSLDVSTFLAGSATSLKSFNSVLLVRDLFIVLLDTMIVVVDSVVVFRDT